MARLRHCYPVNNRPARLNERKAYYSSLDFGLIEGWFKGKPRGLHRPIFHLDPGSESGYIRKKYADKAGKLLYFTIEDFGELKGMLLEYLPEDLYYDRNIYRNREECAECQRRGEGCRDCEELLGQELMFDVDPENIECPNCGSLEDRVKGHSMFKFCFICFNKAIDETLRLYKELKEMGFKDLATVFSGRGFHIHVNDASTLKMSFEERGAISDNLLKKGIPLDKWVTDGEARLARAPYSLNGIVSKVCLPIRIEDIRINNYWKESPFLPDFMLQSISS
ncbi:MAG: DNA primase [Candidatus Verstraetearchaeota archaeon]|nr:DNA primase [Candidatus Verstraetearchaeota archaeon]